MSLHAANLSCIRQQRLLFENISFQLESGEALLIEGPNGSGKSSLLRLLTDLSTPAAGEIFWRGNSIQNCRDEYISELHYIGHTNGIKSGLTVTENLQLAQRLSLTATTKDQEEILKQLQLSLYKNTPAKNLSAGQQRRIALARLFLIPKKLWLLDEPLTALDTATQQFFLANMEAHLLNGGIVVLSSHHPVNLNRATLKNLRLDTC